MQPRKLPPYNNWQGLPLESPPLLFQDMRLSCMLLRASYTRLQAFIDQYLNRGQTALNCTSRFYFQVSIPYVVAAFIQYGSIEQELSNVGWASQHEVFFAVPLKMYHRVDGRWQLHSFVVNTPFLFADNSTSVKVAREIYGWPKVFGRTAWTPAVIHNATPYVATTIMTEAVPSPYSGESLQLADIIKVTYDPPGLGSVGISPSFGWGTAPVAWPESLWDLATAAQNSTMALLSGPLSWILAAGTPTAPADYLRRINPWTLARAALDPARPALAGLDEVARLAASFRSLEVSAINLKQFPDSPCPDKAVYSALTVSPMVMTHLETIGLLGSVNQLAGDFSGGYRIRIERAGQNIVNALGLVADRVPGDTGYTLRPLFPYQVRADVKYRKGYLLEDRTRKPQSLPTLFAGAKKNAHHDVLHRTRADSESGLSQMYNQTLGLASPIMGEVYSPNTNMYVLPLLATAERLQELVRTYYKPFESAGFQFESWGSIVYLLVVRDQNSVSIENPFSTIDLRRTYFAVPVKIHMRDRTGTSLYNLGYMVPFYYDEKNIASSTQELLGLGNEAQLLDPKVDWLDAAESARWPEGQSLVEICTDLIPVFFRGAQVTQSQLLTVCHGCETPASLSWDAALRAHHSRLNEQRQHDREQDAYVKFLEDTIGNCRSLPAFVLKQFRDVEDVTKACYQALVETAMDAVPSDVRVNKLNMNLDVYITRNPMQKIAAQLGLIPKLTTTKHGRIVEVFEALDPFHVGAKIWYRPGRTIVERWGPQWSFRREEGNNVTERQQNPGERDLLSQFRVDDKGPDLPTDDWDSNSPPYAQGRTDDAGADSPRYDRGRREGGLNFTTTSKADLSKAVDRVDPHVVITNMVRG